MKRNPANPLPDDVERVLAQASQARRAALRMQEVTAKAARLDPGERKLATAVAIDTLHADLPSAVSRFQDIAAGARQRFLTLRHQHESAAETMHHLPLDLTPAPVDHSFWWAETSWFTERGLGSDFLQDGLHFFGSLSYDEDDNMQFHAGALAVFVLQPERWPASTKNRFNSEPHIELFGTIDGWTGYWHPIWFADDKWCKCRLFLRQTARQVMFGQERVLGHGVRVDTILDEENRSRSVSATVPGLLKMPPIQIVDPLPKLDIVVDLEIRFDFELEGDSFIGLSPQNNSAGSVLLRTAQWEPIPV
jgi:hypothetical protein